MEYYKRLLRIYQNAHPSQELYLNLLILKVHFHLSIESKLEEVVIEITKKWLISRFM